MLFFPLCVGEKRREKRKKNGIIRRRERGRDEDICIYTSHLPL
jgi:hypothetical protein